MKKTMAFLNKLKVNNNRDWFQENKEEYLESHEEMAEFGEKLLNGLNGLNEFDEIKTPSGKKSLFRIYRDVRFSKNKEPYKSNRSGSFARQGDNRRGGYYYSIQPGNSMIGGGFYGPSTEDLNHIRKQIELDSEPLRSAFKNKKLKSYYSDLLGEQLKTAPRGFEKDDPNIDLLRYKSFYVMHTFSDDEVLADDFHNKVIEGYKALTPFFDSMTNYLTTDLNGESTID